MNKTKAYMFYVGYREIFEKPERDGYTSCLSKAGKFTDEESEAMIKYNSDGYPRWRMPVETLDSFDGGKLHSRETY
jgi:hypothetical protein